VLKQAGPLNRVVPNEKKPIPRKSLVVRFMEKVDIQPGGCWLWTATTAAGYGWFRHPETHKAHRAAYLMLVGPLEPGQVIDHLCFNTLCVNPDHLDPTTPMVNVHRWTKRDTPWKVCDTNHPSIPTNLVRRPSGQMRCTECHKVGERRRRQQAASRSGGSGASGVTPND
jgi:hypothetical protein